VTLSNDPQSPAFGKVVNVATLEVLVAEKIVAMANAVERRRVRRREQDVFDLAALLADGVEMNLARMAHIVRRRAVAHRFELRPEHFGPTGREYIAQNYAALEALTRSDFIPFDVAWPAVVAFVHRVLGWDTISE
jgi:hypothetical protein